MALTAAEVFDDYNTSGVPSSGNKKPKKSEIRTWAKRLEDIVNAFLSNGGVIYASNAALDADLSKVANTMAWVVEDATAGNNGVYRKVGASGTGSWVRAADLPYSFIVASDTGAGTANALQATSSIPVSSSALVLLNVYEANTSSPVTVSFNGGSPLTIKSNTGNDIVAGGLAADMLVIGRVSGSTFRIVMDQVSTAIAAAAEAAAQIATNKAAEAVAAAAGVDLPPATANTMLVDNATATARESKTFSEVMELLQDAAFSFDNNSLYRARSLKDRWTDSIRVADLLNYDPTGVTANGHIVLQAAINAALAANKSEVVLPRGLLRMANSAGIVCPQSTGKAIRLVGQGEDISTLQSNVANINLLTVGARGSTISDKTTNVIVEGVGFVLGEVSTAGSSVDIRNASDIKFKSCNLGNLPSFLALGLGASGVDDTTYIFLHDCCAASGGAAGVAGIRIGSGASLHITGGGKFNGGDISPFIKHVDTSYNWDGIYCIGTFAEGWTGYIVSNGKGIVNAEWTGGQVDRAAIAFEASAASGGSDRNWNIQTQILEGPPGNVVQFGVVLGGGAGTSEGHSVRNCHMQGMTNNGVYVAKGNAVIIGNVFESCGNGGNPIIRWGSGTFGATVGNHSYKGSLARPDASTGILYEGTGTGLRVAAGNMFAALSGAATTGTA